MKILFVHQNFPGQYAHLARHLATMPEHEVVFITQRKEASIPSVRKIVYTPNRKVAQSVHRYLAGTERFVINAQQVARAALALKKAGFVPDVMVGHNGWGEIWYLKDVFPSAPLLGYFEFFYRYHGADVGFDPDEPVALDDALCLRTRNAGNLLGLEAVDVGQTATEWQKSGYPPRYQSFLRVVHEGIDTRHVAPDTRARVTLPGSGDVLVAGDEVVTYVARNLEPYRGFTTFMRSLPAILEQRPGARVVVVGGDGVSYGHRLSCGVTYRARMMEELGAALDLSRIHFLGQVPYPIYLKILQVSRVHVYLTYPFVLSWSMLEAMSAGCLVVASDTAPVIEVIRDGENGLLVDFFSPTEVSARVVEALREPQAFQPIRNAARRTVIERYDLQTICLPRQLRLLDELVSYR